MFSSFSLPEYLNKKTTFKKVNMPGLISMSAKVTPEVSDQFSQAFEASGCETKNQFYELLLERYLNPKTKPVPTPTEEQAQALQLKDNEIGRLKSALDLEQEASGKMFEENIQLKNIIRELEKSPEPTPAPLPKEHVLVILSPLMSAVLDVEIDLNTKSGGIQLTRGDLLARCFAETIYNGRYTPFRIWSEKELKQKEAKIKEASNGI